MKNIIAWILAISLVLTLALTMLFSENSGHLSETPSDSREESSLSNEETSETPSLPNQSGESSSVSGKPNAANDVQVDSSLAKVGNLIAVNSKNPLKQDLSGSLVKFFSRYNNCYKFSTTELYMDSDALDAFNAMTRAFTDKTDLTDITLYSTYANDLSDEAAAGMTVTLSIVRSESEIYSFYGQNDYAFFYTDGPDYGYILRYPKEKSSVTGVEHKANILRYVGVPHARIITEQELALEEYLSMLEKSHPFSSPLSYTDREGNSYLIYSVKASGSKTTIPLPECESYDISGNNNGYFIVTAKL